MASPTNANSLPPIAAANRINVPAVARIPGRGTATLISPGLLLTSTRVVGTKQEASRLKAVFFESGKRERVEVALLPNQTYFTASYPEHLDYCIVACETKGIFNVTPVHLPMIRREWPQVREGDTVMVVQHPSANNALGSHAASSPAVASALASEGNEQQIEVKRFSEVLRRRDDLLYFKPQGTYTCAGCPVFNEQTNLVALQMQYYDEANQETPVSRAVSVTSIVKHLFANGMLYKIQQKPEFDDVWGTWSIPSDVHRIVSILTNFRHHTCALQTAIRLCEFACERDNVKSVIACGGTRVIIECIARHKDDEAFVTLALRALWTISFGEEDNRTEICQSNGVAVVLDVMGTYKNSEEIQEFGVVLLFNLTLSASLVTDEISTQGVAAVFAAAVGFPKVEVIQKFGIGFFHNIISVSIARAKDLIDIGVVIHTANMMDTYSNREFLLEHAVKLLATIACAPQFHGDPTLTKCVNPIIEAICRFPGSNAISVHGNNALWGLGNDPRCRVLLFAHPKGVQALQNSIDLVNAAQPIYGSL